MKRDTEDHDFEVFSMICVIVMIQNLIKISIQSDIQVHDHNLFIVI